MQPEKELGSFRERCGIFLAVTYYYEVTSRGVFVLAYGGNWTGAQVVAFWPA